VIQSIIRLFSISLRRLVGWNSRN